MILCSERFLSTKVPFGPLGEGSDVLQYKWGSCLVGPHITFFLIVFFFLVLALLVFVAGLGLSLVASSRGYSLVSVRRPLIAVTSLVAEHRIKGSRLSSGGTWGLVARGHVGSSWTGDRTRIFCIGRQILHF